VATGLPFKPNLSKRWFVPKLRWAQEMALSKNAAAHRADPTPGDLRTNGVRNSCPNSISVGGGISANATTWCHTSSGRACISIAVRTTNLGGLALPRALRQKLPASPTAQPTASLLLFSRPNIPLDGIPQRAAKPRQPERNRRGHEYAN